MSALGQILYGLLFLLIVAVGIAGAHALAVGFGLNEKMAASAVPQLDQSPAVRCPEPRGPTIRLELDRQQVVLR